MKKLITPLLLLFVLANSVQAQTAETAVTGTTFADNVWYSLENGTVSTQSATNWDIALAATASQASDLITSALINSKVANLYVIPGATPANFATADTTGINWKDNRLFNEDKTWATGAFNKAPSLSQYDFGYGAYNISNHKIEANKVFVIRYITPTPNVFTYKKLYITLDAPAAQYNLVHANLDADEASEYQTATINISTYNTKNFLYFSLANNAVVDREPTKSSWDILFTQYVSTTESYGGFYDQTVTGVLTNLGVEVAQANPVDQATYEDHGSLTFSEDANIIGWDWKTLVYTATPPWQISTDKVYFVKVSNGDIWKLYFTGFSGSSTGTYSFTKEKMSAVTGLFNATDKASLAVYPNPSSTGNATVVYDFNGSSAVELSVSDLTGNVLYTENINSGSGLTSYTFSTAAFKTGLYIVSMKTNAGLLQQKLMIK